MGPSPGCTGPLAGRPPIQCADWTVGGRWGQLLMLAWSLLLLQLMSSDGQRVVSAREHRSTACSPPVRSVTDSPPEPTHNASSGCARRVCIWENKMAAGNGPVAYARGGLATRLPDLSIPTNGCIDCQLRSRNPSRRGRRGLMDS